MMEARRSIQAGDELGLEELGRTRGCACFAWHNVSATIYTDRATLETVAMLDSVGRAMRKRHALRSIVTFVLGGVAPPEDDARELMSKLVYPSASAIAEA